MSNAEQTYPTGSAGSVKMLRAMVGIGVICALMIVLAFEGTKERIAMLRAAALERAIFKVLPGAVTKETFLIDPQGMVTQGPASKPDVQIVHAGYDKDGILTGLAVEASGMGFADVLRILYGYDPGSGTIVGFYVLESKETPGLGDKIEKDPAFLANFEALDVSLDSAREALVNQVVAVKQGTKKNAWEIDGITGATISSRAIGNIIGTSTAEWVPLIHENLKAFEMKNIDSGNQE